MNDPKIETIDISGKPRCATCRYFSEAIGAAGFKSTGCGKKNTREGALAEVYAPKPDFGCVHWEAR